MNTPNILVASIVACLTVACAHAPPSELVDARAAYERAAGGPAAKYDPAGLHVAKETLTVAEQRFKDDGNTELTRDQAYIAQRKAEYSEVIARIAMLQKGIAEAEEQEEDR